MKYELTDEMIQHSSRTLHRIKALKSFSDVSKGGLGGFVESVGNLSPKGNAWVYGDARVHGNAWVYGNAQVHGDARVYGNAWVHGNARVYGNARVHGNAWVYGNAQVHGNAWVYGDARVYGNAQVHGDARVYGDVWVISPLQIQGTRHFVNLATHSLIKIGCYDRTLPGWLEGFESIGKENGYTESQIKEYKMYLDMCASWLEIHKNVLNKSVEQKAAA
jgi:hypothetical protein